MICTQNDLYRKNYLCEINGYPGFSEEFLLTVIPTFALLQLTQKIR